MSKLYEKNEWYREVALEILKEIKSIEFCPCGSTYKTCKEDCYQDAKIVLENKYPEMTDCNLFRDKIKTILDEGALMDSCPCCEHHF